MHSRFEADLISPLIHSGSLTAGTDVEGAGMTLASLLLSWPPEGRLPLLSARLYNGLKKYSISPAISISPSATTDVLKGQNTFFFF